MSRFGESPPQTLHGTCVALRGAGVLLRGPSGAGKSDLALRLIQDGAELVADDQVEVMVHADQLVASPPATLAGLLEVYGLGIFRYPYTGQIPLGLVIDLVVPEAVERLPEVATTPILGIAIPHLTLDPWAVSAPLKVQLAIDSLTGHIKAVSSALGDENSAAAPDDQTGEKHT